MFGLRLSDFSGDQKLPYSAHSVCSKISGITTHLITVTSVVLLCSVRPYRIPTLSTYFNFFFAIVADCWVATYKKVPNKKSKKINGCKNIATLFRTRSFLQIRHKNNQL